MSTQRTVWWLSGVLVAVLVSVMIASYISRDNAIEGCIRNSEFKNTEALAWEEATKARRADGDFSTAILYEDTARHIRVTIPMPGDYSGAALQGIVRGDRVRGCETAYPPPIPGVE